MRYVHPEREYIRIEVRETLNGYGIFALNLHTNTFVEVTRNIANILDATLPEGFRSIHSTLKAAEKDLKSLAELNGWAELHG